MDLLSARKKSLYIQFPTDFRLDWCKASLCLDSINDLVRGSPSTSDKLILLEHVSGCKMPSRAPGRDVDHTTMNTSSFSQAALSYSQIAHEFLICTSEMTVKLSIITLSWSLEFRAPSTHL